LPRIIPTTIVRPEEIRVFRLTPKVISFLIARTGFGHIDLVIFEPTVKLAKRSAASQEARDVTDAEKATGISALQERVIGQVPPHMSVAEHRQRTAPNGWIGTR
jgi:hypothetical protein